VLDRVILYERATNFVLLADAVTLTSASATSAHWSSGVVAGGAASFGLFYDVSGTGPHIGNAPEIEISYVLGHSSGAPWFWDGAETAGARFRVDLSVTTAGKFARSLTPVPAEWIKFKFANSTTGPNTKLSAWLVKQT